MPFNDWRRNKNRHIFPVTQELAAIRRIHNIHAKVIAERIGVVPSVYCNWEKGHCSPRLAHLIAWANVLGMDLTLCPIKSLTKQPSLNEASPILHSYRALKCSTPGIARR